MREAQLNDEFHLDSKLNRATRVKPINETVLVQVAQFYKVSSAAYYSRQLKLLVHKAIMYYVCQLLHSYLLQPKAIFAVYRRFKRNAVHRPRGTPNLPPTIP